MDVPAPIRTPPIRTPLSGQSLRRLEDERFLRGAGRYLDDAGAAGHLHAHVVRSPHAHARILGIRMTAAAAAGVAGVYTAADLRTDGIGPLPCIARVATEEPLVVPPRPALAEGVVRHVGDPVALVVAHTRQAARDAAELVEVDYEPLPAVVDATAALAPGAPLLWPQAPGNLAFRFRKGDPEAVRKAMEAAAVVVQAELVNNRVVAAPIEPRAAIGRHDSGRLDLQLSGQGVHALRDQLAEVFGLPPDRIRVASPDVGGGFGAKNFLYPEYVLVLFAARRLGHPVRWISDRTEDFLSSAQGRDNRTRARLALDRDGRLLALEVDTVADMGAHLSTSGPGSSTNSYATAMGGLYDIPAIALEVRGAFTNTVPIDAYRGAGKPEANYVIERLIDLAARQTGRDPVALRRRNLIAALPHRTALGMTIDSGRFAENLDAAVASADHAGFAARRAASAAAGRLRGIGVACFLETARGQPGEAAGVAFRPDGRVALISGTQSNGQGHETSFPQIAADRLGLPIGCFELVQADTRTVPSGAGHGGARSMHMGGAALVLALGTVITKGRAIAAQLLQCAPEALDFAEGAYVLAGDDPGTGRSVGLSTVARMAETAGGNALDCHVATPLDVFTFPNGCHVAEVEIDPQTGAVRLLRYTAVDDYGVLINPLLTAGQVQGGVAQGIGQALHEATAYDAGSGQLVSASFMDYALPRADDLPALDIGFAGVPTAANPLGVKGAGQAGCIAAPQAIMTAVLDALAPLGVRDLDMPATPERVWRAIRAVAP
jgi:carbon-monoxide dehydrogenase large subunit